MPIAKRQMTQQPQFFALNTLSCENFPTVASAGAGVANTTIQAYYVLPTRCKINKVVFACTALAAVTGTHKFNIVVGTGAYTQGSVASNDNSYDQALPGGLGYCTNPAVTGNALFAADVPIVTAGNTALSNSEMAGGFTTGAGGYAIFIPTSYDAVYKNGALLTLRFVTPGSTGSFTNVVVGFLFEPVSVRPSNLPTEVITSPGVDF